MERTPRWRAFFVLSAAMGAPKTNRPRRPEDGAGGEAKQPSSPRSWPKALDPKTVDRRAGVSHPEVLQDHP